MLNHRGDFGYYAKEHRMQSFQPPTRTRQKPPLHLSAFISALGGALALLGFFLPWVMFASISLSGWFLVQHAADPLYGLSVTSIAETYLTFAGAIATLLIGLSAVSGRHSPTLTNIQVLSSLIGVSDLILNLVNLNGSQFNLTVLGAGFWISFVGFVLGVVGAIAARGKMV
jgi:hypothetical protein